MTVLTTLRSVVRFRSFERDFTQRTLNKMASIDDLRLEARRRLPGGVFDYIDGAAEDEIAASKNRHGFSNLELQPRVLRDVSHIDTSTELFGQQLPLPLILAPTGFSRIASPQGELDVARAAGKTGVPYTLSTLSTRSIEEVATASKGPHWFQIYMWRDRGLVASMLDRAAAAGFTTAMLTVDTAVLGQRDRDVRRGFTLPPKIGLDTILDGIRHPAWTWAFARSEPIRFANVQSETIGDGTHAVAPAAYINSQFDPTMTWDDLDWLRSHWKGPIILKGIQTTADAERAAKSEAVDAIAVSNHGGRQLDAAPAPINQLSAVVEAVDGAIPIICDGEIRRGSDIVKACALGATAVMIGRPYLYGLAVGGEKGVHHVIRSLQKDTERTLALCGIPSINELTPDIVTRSMRGCPLPLTHRCKMS